MTSSPANYTYRLSDGDLAKLARFPGFGLMVGANDAAFEADWVEASALALSSWRTTSEPVLEVRMSWVQHVVGRSRQVDHQEFVLTYSDKPLGITVSSNTWPFAVRALMGGDPVEAVDIYECEYAAESIDADGRTASFHLIYDKHICFRAKSGKCLSLTTALDSAVPCIQVWRLSPDIYVAAANRHSTVEEEREVVRHRLRLTEVLH
ncbi:hypothetical protein [Mesorhizobium australicum]|uniref:Uncharacterized protein n=1 Tax=Mesorhizobium australicum TaxID=536018 RepID=A0A1X7MT45_9HYPH|nr:hypothetical protein [Mesorhizobium australicum]SMH27518.1 hypothetical protein SAMN02982922_0544 [Mesorhizobium australicum]